MQILLFIEAHWLAITIISAIIFIIWGVREIILTLVNPTFKAIDLESQKYIDLDAFSSYQKELSALGFQHYGDFKIKLLESPMGAEASIDMGEQQVDSVFIDADRAIIAYISRTPDSKRERIEYTTYFQDGTQLNSRNSREIRTIKKELPMVTTNYYPRSCAEDLLYFQNRGIKEHRHISKPEPLPEDIMAKKIEGIKKRNEYNYKRKILVKDKSGNYYKTAYLHFLRSMGLGILELLSMMISPVVDVICPLKKRTYRIGLQDPEARELFKRKKTIRVVFGLYFLFPIAAFVYKFFFMHPDPFGYFTILWSAVFMAMGFAVFIKLRATKVVLILESVYFPMTGAAVFINLWTAGITPFLIFHTVLMIGMMVVFSKIDEHKQPEKKAVPLISIVLFLMGVLILFSLRTFGFIYSFRHLQVENVESIRIYDFPDAGKWDKPFDFEGAELEVELKDRTSMGAFVSHFGDTTPFFRERGVVQGEYLVIIAKRDRTSLFFILGKGNDRNKDVAAIGFVTPQCLTSGKYYGFACNREYQSKELYNFLLTLELKKWSHPKG